MSFYKALFTIPPEHVLALLGMSDLNAINEPESQISAVFDIVYHPEWRFHHDADISIVILLDPVEFSSHIQPICLPSKNSLSSFGTIAGWNSSGNETKVNVIHAIIENRNNCFQSANKSRNFCGRYKDKIRSPCFSDGTGLYFLERSSPPLEYWNVGGVSSKDDRKSYTFCDSSNQSIYSDVSKFVEWIQVTVNQTEEVEDEMVDMECRLSEEG